MKILYWKLLRGIFFITLGKIRNRSSLTHWWRVSFKKTTSNVVRASETEILMILIDSLYTIWVSGPLSSWGASAIKTYMERKSGSSPYKPIWMAQCPRQNVSPLLADWSHRNTHAAENVRRLHGRYSIAVQFVGPHTWKISRFVSSAYQNFRRGLLVERAGPTFVSHMAKVPLSFGRRRRWTLAGL